MGGSNVSQNLFRAKKRGELKIKAIFFTIIFQKWFASMNAENSNREQ